MTVEERASGLSSRGAERRGIPNCQRDPRESAVVNAPAPPRHPRPSARARHGGESAATVRRPGRTDWWPACGRRRPPRRPPKGTMTSTHVTQARSPATAIRMSSQVTVHGREFEKMFSHERSISSQPSSRCHPGWTQLAVSSWSHTCAHVFEVPGLQGPIKSEVCGRHGCCIGGHARTIYPAPWPTTRDLPVLAARGFPPTRHSAVLAAQSEIVLERERGLSILIDTYWKPAYKYLRRSASANPTRTRRT